MELKKAQIGTWLQEGFNLYKQNFLLLIVASFLAVLLGKVTLGILMGPMAAGMMLIVLRLIDNAEPKPEIGDVFKGFEFFLDTFLLVLASIVVYLVAIAIFALIFNPIITVILVAFAALFIHLVFALSICLIVDKKLDFWPAVMMAMGAIKSAILPMFCIMLLTLILSSIGAVAFLIGLIVTMPLYWCIMAVVYRDMLRADELAPVA